MKRVLIVDDSKLIREKIMAAFRNESNDLDITAAADGLEGIELQQKTPFDLIITDLIMPKMEGIEFIKRVRKSSTKTKIIAMTGSNPLYLEIAEQLGADYNLSKPFKESQLLDLSYQLLNQNYT